MTTFLAVAELSKLEFTAVEADGAGTLERAEDRRYRVAEIRLRPRVTVRREADRERALPAAERALQLAGGAHRSQLRTRRRTQQRG